MNVFVYKFGIIYNIKSSFVKKPFGAWKRNLQFWAPTCSRISFVVKGTGWFWVHPSVFSGVRVTRCLVLCVMFCRTLFVPLSFLFCQLCFLSFDFWILITPLVFSNYSYSWHKRNLFASMKSSDLLIRNMLQSESWKLTDVISLNAVIHRIKEEKISSSFL